MINQNSIISKISTSIYYKGMFWKVKDNLRYLGNKLGKKNLNNK